jgi:hypothetical protein
MRVRWVVTISSPMVTATRSCPPASASSVRRTGMSRHQKVPAANATSETCHRSSNPSQALPAAHASTRAIAA